MTDLEEKLVGLGELKSDVAHIKETLLHMESIMETSFVRGGERMGKLEDGLNAVKLDVASHKEKDEATAEKVSKLDSAKNWFIVTIIGSYLAGIAAKFWK